MLLVLTKKGNEISRNHLKIVLTKNNERGEGGEIRNRPLKLSHEFEKIRVYLGTTRGKQCYHLGPDFRHLSIVK
jgi:hypothetical protein